MNKAIDYARAVIEDRLFDNYGEKVAAPRYVLKQCEEWLRIVDGKDKKYTISEKKVTQIDGILKLLNMPKGLKAGKRMHDCLCGYQALFIYAVLATVERDNAEKRKYENGLLEVCRKNFKTYTVALIFIILFLTEPNFSRFYSVAPDGSLSREVKEAITETIKASPLIYKYKEKARFKMLRDSVTFLPTETKYIPLNYSSSRFDGKLPNAFLADEVGALPNSYAIEAMRSGQLNILNKLGCVISTKYPTYNNPFEDEVAYAKKVLDGHIQDESLFALLYEPDDPTDWTSDDLIIKQSNPASLENKEIYEDLLKKRARAIEVENARENFLTKHCNIIYQGAGTENFVPVDSVLSCKLEKIDFRGKQVYVGVDLAMTTDNCAVALSYEEDGEIYSDVVAFIPEGRINEKNQIEHIDYRRFITQGKCIACGDMTVDYKRIEDFVFGLEKKLGCTIVAIGYDRYNALSSAQKWEEQYTTVQVRQHSDTLHPPTKLLGEYILNGTWHYEKNTLLEINFENAKCAYDTNMNKYIHKKKSNGKVDMVMALINSIYLLQQDVILYDNDFVVQTV